MWGQALRILHRSYNSPGGGGLDQGRGSRDDEEQDYQGHVSKQKRQVVSTSPSELAPLTVGHPHVCPHEKQTHLLCLQEQARTVSWVAKVAVTLSGFPTQLSEKQILSSAALSAPLCIRTALHVTELLKLWIAVLCQAMLC